ncbi:MAG TPA: hypothetical protein DCP10_03490 [Bacteroidales bacterium]|nr:hypothetical protein [Bacteroidales bacterium]
MRKIIIIQLLVTILLLSCKKDNEKTLCTDYKLEQSTLNNELDYEIINSVLETYFINSDFIHIVQKTTSPVHSEFIKDKLVSENIVFDSLLLSDYSEKNSNAYFLSSNNFELNTVRLINPTETNCFFSVEYKGWGNYYKKYPKSTGLHSFSRPGINNTGNQTIIEYGWQAHYDTGMGYLVVLEKVNNKWIVKNRMPTWAL